MGRSSLTSSGEKGRSKRREGLKKETKKKRGQIKENNLCEVMKSKTKQGHVKEVELLNYESGRL